MSTATVTGRTRGGSEWVPQFVESLNIEKCIGCGRCYKVCPRNVFELASREDLLDEDSDSDEFDTENSMVMTIHDKDDCIGCQACSKVCPKDCHTHKVA